MELRSLCPNWGEAPNQGIQSYVLFRDLEIWRSEILRNFECSHFGVNAIRVSQILMIPKSKQAFVDSELQLPSQLPLKMFCSLQRPIVFPFFRTGVKK